MTSLSKLPRILVVEDDDNIAQALEYIVQREGCAHERISRGGAAMGRIRDTRPDLVLLDVMLPEMSGYDICREVRGDPSLAGVRILLMTAAGSSTERRRALDMGADGFVSKPFDLADLRHEVRKLLPGG